MKDILYKIALVAVGFTLGGFLSIMTKPDPIITVSSDTTIVEELVISWEYPPVITQEVKGEILPSDTTKVQNPIHRIPIEVKEGNGYIDYDIQTRLGALSWTPSPIRREHAYTFETVNIKTTIEEEVPTTFFKSPFTYGVATGFVGTVILIKMISGVL